MNRWKENLGTKKRTGDGAARWARRIFCAFLIVIGCLVLADGVGDAVRRAENRDSQSEGNVEQNLSGKSDSNVRMPTSSPGFAFPVLTSTNRLSRQPTMNRTAASGWMENRIQPGLSFWTARVHRMHRIFIRFFTGII